MKLAIMQPYLFPYIGYFQLIAAVDKFVIYDDVSYIKQGWINRNRVLVSGNPLYFTVPLKDRSSFRSIRETEIAETGKWREKLLRTIEMSYKKAPFFSGVFELVQRVFSAETGSVGELAALSIREVVSYLELPTEIVESSTVYANSDLNGPDRVMDICLRENADEYINASGGMELYSKEKFAEKGLGLSFIKTRPVEYKQFNNEFVPWLSIIDVLMFNPKEKVREFLGEYDLV